MIPTVRFKFLQKIIINGMNVQYGKVSTKGQITLPKEFRDQFNVKSGGEVIIIPTEEGILIKPKKNTLKQLRGLLQEELDVSKAESFIQAERRKWRIETNE